ncbi:fimbria/pilus periplasmic chaperone [Vibrio hippocampi]|uniref:Chaperone protein FaeE n=1 Tax=Vibrio hippocampi TaxID=654686 RepID=A0ABN8DLR9_9VIBR|nr:fimbria/pilus periplasmic chaperone [Vibrio hippocampi]CAH0530405.1 Chaperone protein FaeE [Vibrio hippocampi]
MSIVSKLLTLLLFIPLPLWAAFSLDGTRFVYHETAKSMEVQVTNSEERDYGGQVWVENYTHSAQESYFAIYPALFKIGGQSVQQVKFINIAPLSKDQESLFYINVQEIPPIASDNQMNNAIAIAITTKVKLFYRPESLKKDRPSAEKNITARRTAKGIVLENPTPYYFAVTKVHQLPDLPKATMDNLAIFSPQSEVILPVSQQTQLKELSFLAINDYGGRNEYTVSINE